MENQNYFFQVPFKQQEDKELVKSDKNLHIVGIIDASGSMSSWWKWIAEFYNIAIPKTSLKTITFDHKIHYCEQDLTERIQNHGGGMTAIPEVFSAFEQHLQTIPVDKNITVLFISDGQDNHQNTLEERMNKLKGNIENRKINFVCLGIKSGFPTFLSMQLRKLYHRGDDAIPALFLIEHVSEKAFFNKFEGIKKYFYSAGSCKIEPAIQFFPWDETVSDDAYEGSWVITQASTLKVDGVEYKVQSSNLNVEQLVDIFRGWVQQIQLKSLTNMQEAQKTAQIALQEINKHIERANKDMGLNVLMKLDEQNNLVGDPFCLRTKKNYIIRFGGKLLWFLEEITQLAEGKVQNYDNEFEAAKKMNLGTITGKYQQKVLALKNIPANKFMSFVDEFKQILDKTKLEKTEYMSCVKNVLIQPDFLEGLEYIRNQYDFVEMFELTGNGFKLKRSDQTEINPYAAEAKGVSKEILDYPTIIQKDFNIQVKGKDKVLFGASEVSALENDFVDEINAVVPFFSKQNDSDISPLLNTNLIHMAFSYLITQNADVLLEDSYLVIIGHFLTVVFNQFNNNPEQLQLKKQYLQKAYESLYVYYRTNQSFQQRQLLLTKNPQIYFKNYGNDHVLKTLTMVFYLVQGGNLNQEQKQKLFEIFNLMFFKKFVANYNNDLNKILKPEITQKDKDIISKYFQENIDSFYSISAFRKGFSTKLLELLMASTSDAVIPRKDLYNSDKNELNLLTLESFGKLMEFQPYKFTDYSIMAKHVCENPENYLDNEINWDIKDLNKVVQSQLTQENIKFVPGYSVFFQDMENMYLQNFQQKHWGIRPIKKEEIENICKEKGYDFSKLQFTISGLLENACLAEKCSYFLQATEDLDKHLAGWQGKIPKGFHRFINSRLEMNPQQLMKDAKQKWGKAFPNKFGVDEKYVINYFKETLEAYQINKYGKIQEFNDEEQKKKEQEFNESIAGIVKQNWLKKIEKAGFNPFQGNEFRKVYKQILSEENGEKEEVKQQEQVEVVNKKPWICQSCTVENEGKNNICYVCNWNPSKPDEWICPDCTFVNNPKSKICVVCNQGVQPKREAVVQQPQQDKKKEEGEEEEEKKQEEVQKDKNQFEKNQEQIPVNLRNKWNNEQKYLKSLLNETDDHLSFKVVPKPIEGNPKNVEFENLKYIAGVDISFSQDVENFACSYLTILSFPDLKVVYEDHQFVKLNMPYVSGFLAFREAAHLLKLFGRLFKAQPELTPQVIMVDGNGVLHQNGCGLASHLGILLDIPTIGVGKTTFYADGLTKEVVSQNFQKVAQQKGDYSYLQGQSGRIWGAALKSEENVKNPIYVSIGTNISLDTACQLVQQCSKFRIPEPVRLADLTSREKIRQLGDLQQQQLVEDNELPFLTDFVENEFPDNPDALDINDNDKGKKRRGGNNKRGGGRGAGRGRGGYKKKH